MAAVDELFDAAPLWVLFVTVALGYFVGRFKVGRPVLGGIVGVITKNPAPEPAAARHPCPTRISAPMPS